MNAINGRTINIRDAKAVDFHEIIGVTITDSIKIFDEIRNHQNERNFIDSLSSFLTDTEIRRISRNFDFTDFEKLTIYKEEFENDNYPNRTLIGIRKDKVTGEYRPVYKGPRTGHYVKTRNTTLRGISSSDGVILFNGKDYIRL